MHNKLITTIGLLIVGIFISITTVNAADKIVFSENSNGNIKATLHFEDGFVGGLDITLKYSGDVKLKQFNLDSKLNNVNPKDEKDKIKINDKTITIRLTMGGVGPEYNLLNKNKELVLGNLLFETSSKSNVSYTIECTALTAVGNDWNSKNIEPELENNKLTFKINSSTEDKDNDKDNNPSSGNNNDSSNTGSSGNNSSSGNSSGNNTSSGTQNNNSNSSNSSSNNSSNSNNTNNGSSAGSNNQSSNGNGNNQNNNSESNNSNQEGNASGSENNSTLDGNIDSDDNEDQKNDEDDSQEDDEEESLGMKILEIVIGVALVAIAGTICFFAIKPKKADK